MKKITGFALAALLITPVATTSFASQIVNSTETVAIENVMGSADKETVTEEAVMETVDQNGTVKETDVIIEEVQPSQDTEQNQEQQPDS